MDDFTRQVLRDAGFVKKVGSEWYFEPEGRFAIADAVKRANWLGVIITYAVYSDDFSDGCRVSEADGKNILNQISRDIITPHITPSRNGYITIYGDIDIPPDGLVYYTEEYIEHVIRRGYELVERADKIDYDKLQLVCE